MAAVLSHARRLRLAAWLLPLAAAIGLLAYWRVVVERRASATFTISLGPGETISVDPAGAVAISQDGSSIAFVAGTANRPATLRLWNERDFTSHVVTGTEDASGPFFSSDGQWIGFAAQGKLMKIAIGGGVPIAICNLAGPLRGADWAPNGQIYFGLAAVGDGSSAALIQRVDAAGGAPRPALSSRSDERWQAWPQMLPGGSALLYVAAGAADGASGTPTVYAQSLASAERVVVAQADHASVSAGYVIYSTAGGLSARRFDPATLHTSGSESRVPLEPVRGSIEFAASAGGTLVYGQRPAHEGSEGAMLVWVDRQGLEVPLRSQRAAYDSVALSPDGRHVALQIGAMAVPIVWTYDVASGELRQLPYGGKLMAPIWTADGKALTTRGHVTGDRTAHVYVMPLDGRAPVETLIDYSQSVLTPTSWSADGRLLAVEDSSGGVKYFALDDRRLRSVPMPSARGRATSPQLSPDGRWLAYVWETAGERDVYVQSLESPDQKRRISDDGGTMPRWNRNGKELFYLAGGHLMSVFMGGTSPIARASEPARLADGPYRTFDVAADGQRFLAITAEGPTQNRLTVLRNWPGSQPHR